MQIRLYGDFQHCAKSKKAELCQKSSIVPSGLDHIHAGAGGLLGAVKLWRGRVGNLALEGERVFAFFGRGWAGRSAGFFVRVLALLPVSCLFCGSRAGRVSPSG